MSKIIAKLNLNKTPQLAENNSLVMAKNIRLLEDGTIGPDTSMEEVETKTGESLPYIVHHDAVIENVDVTKFSILAPTEALTYDKLGFAPNHPTSNNCLKFNITGSPYTSNNDIYCEKNTNIAIKIKAFYVTSSNTIGTFVNQTCFYNTTDKIIDSGSQANTKVFLLAIYKPSYINGIGHSTIPSDMEEWYYIFTNKNNLNNQISISDGLGNSYDYIIINPTYETIVTEENIITPASDETLYSFDTIKYISQIVGLDNKIYFFKESGLVKDSTDARNAIAFYYPNETFIIHGQPNPSSARFDVDDNGYVTHDGVLFEDFRVTRFLIRNDNDRIKIFEYDEVLNTFSLVRCSWHYNGGEINGCVTVNSTGGYILTICEYNVLGTTLVPIKHINLSRCSEDDDETIYTQAPNIPISNLNLERRYVKNIPAGVYQFFIRYKIHENFYTNWFPCSKELFAASHKTTDTLQGSLNFIDLHEDSNYSFVFNIQHLFPQFNINFEQYQLGFIISAEGGVFARAWKHFDINAQSDTIYFDYQQEDIEEINIDDLLKPTYEIFNVENVAPYKNKLYIANYKETDFNEALQEYAEKINIKFKLYETNPSSSKYLNNLPLHFDSTSNLYDYFGDTHLRETYYNPIYNHIESSTERLTSTSEEHNHYYPIYGYQGFPDNFYAITKVYFVYNNQEYIIEYVPTYTVQINGIVKFDNSCVKVEESSDLNLISPFINTIKDAITGLDSSYIYKAIIDNTEIPIDTIYIEYFSIEYHNLYYIDGGYRLQTIINKYKRTFDLSFLTENITTTSTFEEANTLLPFTAYDFYVHYIKQNGVITNGYFIGTKEATRYCKPYKYTTDPPVGRPYELQVEDAIDDLTWYTPETNKYATNGAIIYKLEDISTTNYIIYPTFENIECPSGYIGCFFSIYKKGNDVAQCFNYDYDDTSVSNQATHIMDCLELDTMLYNVHENITIKDSAGNVVTNAAKYYSSSTINPVEYLGCSGHIEFTEDTSNNDDYGEITTIPWVVIRRDNTSINRQLIKLTPYINLTTTSDVSEGIDYANWKDINSPGYYCEIKKLSRVKCDSPTGYYVSGSDIYTRGGYEDQQHQQTASEPALELEDGFVNYYNTNPIQALSNFNLNYLSLSNDLIPKIRTYNHADSSDGVTIPSDKQYITIVDSLLTSFILELKAWFKDYTRKLFSVYDRNKFIEFNNTLRVSNVDIDEVYRYIYKFEATDYYNVPTQRGIITNVIAIANTVYVHCQHSLFKFTDNKTMQAQEEEVVLQENDIFNSGISEVFDAQYGYAGLADRKHSLVTYNAYVFYDSIAKIIYAFGGEQQIANISTTIQKIIDYVNPTDVKFVGDERHNRFFVNLINASGNCCLSFNFINKAFVSVHDIHFKYGFHSRSNSYFVHDNYNQSQLIGWSIYRLTDYIETELQTVPTTYKKNYITYQNCYTPSIIYVQDNDNIIPEQLNIVNACVDVIINTEYEKIKVLNYISWICSEIINYGANQNFVAEEELNRAFPGTKLRIYTDSTNTALIELLDANGDALLSNNQRNIDAYGNITPNPNSWKYPQYNCGVFSMNYFRDVRNTTDVFDYKDNTNKLMGLEGHSKTTDLTQKTQRLNLTQENSLIYGKYIVVRFIFNNRNFKLENVIVRMNDYEKTK